MSVQTRELAVFVEVARELSFARAAESLGMSQPALTRMIQKLEKKVGAQLLERTTRKVQLTRAGESFHVNAEELMKRLDQACDTARRLANGSLGELRVGYNDFAIIGPLAQIIRDFRQNYPGVSPTLSRGSSQRQFIELEAGSLDVGLVIPPVDHPHLVGRRAWDEALCVVLPAGHSLASLERVPLERLDGCALVVGEASRWGAYRQRLDKLFGAAGVTPSIAAEGPDTQVILGLVEAGFGVTVYPECIRDHAGRGLVVRPLDCGAGIDQRIETYVCWHRENDAEVVRNFVASLDAFLDARADAPRATAAPVV